MENIDVMLVPLRGLLLEIGNFLPRLGVALAVIVVGWLLAKGLRMGVVKAMRALNFHILTERAGIDGFLKQGGTEKDTVEWFGIIVYVLVLIASLIVAFNTLGLTQVTDLLGKVLVDEGQDLIIEEPGYLGAIQAFSVYQPNFKPITLAEDGGDKERLRCPACGWCPIMRGRPVWMPRCGRMLSAGRCFRCGLPPERCWPRRWRA